VLNSLVDRVGMDPALVDDVFMVRLLAVFIIYIASHCIALHCIASLRVKDIE
jgi:hypothetical protein